MGNGLRILIVDDQPRARQGMIALLATWPHLEDVREAGNGLQALRMVELFGPQVVLMDARMPEMDGVAATRAIKARWPGIKVIVLSMSDDYLDSALLAGADAFISKAEIPEKLFKTLGRMGPFIGPAADGDD